MCVVAAAAATLIAAALSSFGCPYVRAAALKLPSNQQVGNTKARAALGTLTLVFTTTNLGLVVRAAASAAAALIVCFVYGKHFNLRGWAAAQPFKGSIEPLRLKCLP